MLNGVWATVLSGSNAQQLLGTDQNLSSILGCWKQALGLCSGCRVSSACVGRLFLIFRTIIIMRFAAFSFGPGTFRICLAAAVFLSHVSRFDFGRPAVMIFFMLSGFWVARMQGGAHRQNYMAYLLSRALRIWPQLAVTAIAVLMAYTILGMPIPGSLFSTIGLLGLATRQNDIIGVVWSLDIEMQFYILLPILLLMATSIDRLWKLILLTAILFVAGYFLYLKYKILTVFVYFPMFSAGFSIYLFEWKVSRRAAVLCAILGVIGLAVLNWPPFHFSRVAQIHRDIVFMSTALIFTPFVAWNVFQTSNSVDRLLGNLSYPLYLVHEPCNFIAQAFAPRSIWKGIGLVASMIAGLALYIAADRPIERFRARIRKQMQGHPNG